MDYRLNETEIEGALDELERMRAAIERLPLAPSYEDWFRRRNWVRTIHGTTHIEGNTLNDEEVEEVLVEGPGDNVSRRDGLEIINSRAATKLADEIAAQSDLPIDEATIREVHRRFLADIADLHRPGEYRRGENRVTDGEGNLIFSTPASGDVPELMRRFGIWLRDGCDSRRAPIAAALAALELVAIHPFYDGNGRTSRLLARILLRRSGYEFRNIVSLDAQLDLDRPNYFKAIRKAAGRTYKRGYDATPFVAYFISVLNQAMRYTIDRIAVFERVHAILRVEAAAGRIPAPSVEPLAYTWVNRAIRPSRYRELTRRTPQLTTYDLGRLAAAGYLEPMGATKRRKYLIGPALEGLGNVDRAQPAIQVMTERDIFE